MSGHSSPIGHAGAGRRGKNAAEVEPEGRFQKIRQAFPAGGVAAVDDR